ncbi:hypothetical protein [uncultured Tateyamaria sp.]|uniref:hypothetical protein n=1 Tax=uncultured Tateyamaria sp. TaxID=455651 RepID=UPI00262B71BA|nr:hypothetical protein [uncultured Tateyamaria sp.]
MIKLDLWIARPTALGLVTLTVWRIMTISVLAFHLVFCAVVAIDMHLSKSGHDTLSEWIWAAFSLYFLLFSAWFFLTCFQNFRPSAQEKSQKRILILEKKIKNQ